MPIIRNINRRSFLYECELEYIHTNGKQMFLTDWIPGLKPRIELDFRRENVRKIDGLKNTLFIHSGVYNYPNNSYFAINNGDGGYQGDSFFFWNDKKYGYEGVLYPEKIPIFNGKRNKIAMDWNYVYWTDNGTWKDRQLELRQGKCSYPIYLFGQEGAPYNRSDLYIYGVKCWNDDILERNYIPYFRGNTAGLLDTITNTFGLQKPVHIFCRHNNILYS